MSHLSPTSQLKLGLESLVLGKLHVSLSAGVAGCGLVTQPQFHAALFV
jgi:hypothetical protein